MQPSHQFPPSQESRYYGGHTRCGSTISHRSGQDSQKTAKIARLFFLGAATEHTPLPIHRRKVVARAFLRNLPERLSISEKQLESTHPPLALPPTFRSVGQCFSDYRTRMIQKVCFIEHGAELEECKICHQHSSLSSVASYYFPPRHSRDAGSCIYAVFSPPQHRTRSAKISAKIAIYTIQIHKYSVQLSLP